ncbi:MAG: type II toxin-antitoxin system VapC family toxin [Chitinophagales bacterium]|nr:type II toxin-antitoxin system VapC family toxin [Chitinophagales bacterium]
MSGSSLILDTCFIIDVFSNKVNTKKYQKNKLIYIPSIVIGELFYGANLSKLPLKNIAKINDFISNFSIVKVDEETAEFYGRIKSKLKEKGNQIPENDIWIASLALQHKSILITNDKHFNVIQQLTLLSY